MIVVCWLICKSTKKGNITDLMYPARPFQTIDVRSPMLPSQYEPNNIIRRTWLLILFMSITLLVVSVSTNSQEVCGADQVDCSSVNVAAALAILGCLFSVSSFCLYHLWQIDRLTDVNLARCGAILALILFISSTANVSITTTKSLDIHIGAIEGSIFFLCWGVFGMSLNLGLRYFDVFTLQAKSLQDEDEATAPYSRTSSRGSTISVEDIPDADTTSKLRLTNYLEMPKLGSRHGEGSSSKKRKHRSRSRDRSHRNIV